MESNKQKETKQDTSTLPNKEELSEDIIDINKVLETLEPEKRSKIVSAFMALETEHSFVVLCLLLKILKLMGKLFLMRQNVSYV